MKVFRPVFLLIAFAPWTMVPPTPVRAEFTAVRGEVLPLRFDEQGASASVRRIAIRDSGRGELREILVSAESGIRPGDTIEAVTANGEAAVQIHHLSHTHHSARSETTVARCLPFEGPRREPITARATGVDTALARGNVPALSSSPGSAKHIYLDFDGHPAGPWGDYSAAATPAYSQDGDTSSFTAGELESITQIWAQVAEKYSPFDIDVTTVDPGDFSDGRGLRIVIGGNGGWLGGSSGGVSYIGSFYNHTPNISWVFEDNLTNGTPRYVADAIAHEAGHAFGLRHQSEANLNGSCRYAYAAGNQAKSPLMGFPYVSARSIWWNGLAGVGTANGCSIIGPQSDFEALLSAANGFVLRGDDHGGLQAPRQVDASADGFTASGVIEHPSDADCFAFFAPAGAVRLSTEGPLPGKMLDSSLSIFNPDGTLHASAVPGEAIGATLTTAVGAGRYTACVTSAGAYGDLGSYRLEAAFGDGFPIPNLGDGAPARLGIEISSPRTRARISRRAKKVALHLVYQGAPNLLALRVNGRSVKVTESIKDQYLVPLGRATMRSSAVRISAEVWDDAGNSADSSVRLMIAKARRRR